MSHPTEGHSPIPPELAELLAPRILRRVTKQADGCWIRTVCRSTGGYTHISRTTDGKRVWYWAHRVMYVATRGPIPDGMTVDHICEQRACCNPEHLRAVDHRANVLRGANNPFAINARKERCLRGHEFLPHPSRKGWRYCPECNRIRQAEYDARKRAMRGAA